MNSNTFSKEFLRALDEEFEESSIEKFEKEVPDWYIGEQADCAAKLLMQLITNMWKDEEAEELAKSIIKLASNDLT